MDNKDIIELLSSISFDEQVNLNDIPNIDLYMDQVTTFMDSHFKKYKRNEKDTIVTKTMINNYTKNKIIPPPLKKKYTKNHILLLLLTFHLKHALSINDIKILLNNITKPYDEIKSENSKDILSHELESIYKAYIDLEKLVFKDLSENITKTVNNINNNLSDNDFNDNEKSKLLILILLLITQANTQKFLAEKLIDDYFLEK